MGSTLQREVEMYILLILLVSPAFGRPSSPQLEVGSEIDNQLDSFVDFSHEAGKLLRDSSMIEDVVGMLLVAEKDMIEMTAELTTLKSGGNLCDWFIWKGILSNSSSTVEEIKDVGDVFPKFNVAKSYLRETREELEQLAYGTVIDVNDLKPLIEALDKTDNTIFLNISISKMKNLMNKTLNTLEEAKQNYNSAMEDIEEINFFFKAKHRELSPFATQYVESTSVCYRRPEFEKWETIVDRMVRGTNNLDRTIKSAFDILKKEIELIGKWNQNAKNVNVNTSYTKEILIKYQSIRLVFITGLDELKKSAEGFLARQKDILD